MPFVVCANYKSEIPGFLKNSTVIGEPPKKTIEDKTKKLYNKGVKEKVVWNDKNHFYQEERDEQGRKFYEVCTIYRNNNFIEKDVRKIYSHIFIIEHILENELGRLDTNWSDGEGVVLS